MEVDVRSIVQSAIQVGSTTTKLQDCGNLTMRSQWQIHRTQWCFSIACIWLVSLDFCFSAMGQATWNRLYLYNASTHAALTSPQYLIPLVWEQHLKCNLLCGCFLFGRHTVNISFLIIITVLGIVAVWPLPVFTHQSGVSHFCIPTVCVGFGCRFNMYRVLQNGVGKGIDSQLTLNFEPTCDWWQCKLQPKVRTKFKGRESNYVCSTTILQNLGSTWKLMCHSTTLQRIV